MKARELYNDCIHARDLLDKAIQEKKTIDARILWFSSITMLRAIGHVLKKVDAVHFGEEFEQKLNRNWNEWKNEPIFKEFIDKERNNIIKEYDSTFSATETTKSYYLRFEGKYSLRFDGDKFLSFSDTVTEYIKNSGHSSCKSPVEVITEALKWWDDKLDKIENI